MLHPHCFASPTQADDWNLLQEIPEVSALEHCNPRMSPHAGGAQGSWQPLIFHLLEHTRKAAGRHMGDASEIR